MLLNYPSIEEQQKEGCSQSLLVIPAAGLGGYFLCHFWLSGCILALCLPVLMKKESKKVTKI